MVTPVRTGDDVIAGEIKKQPQRCLLIVDTCHRFDYAGWVIRTFKHKALAELWGEGRSRRVDRRLESRILRLLDRLDQAGSVRDMDFAGTQFHALRGFKPTRYTVHVNGPWCITFEFADGHAYEVDLEQYH
jgi:proteic killer suppression protein